ncbi:23S rRNA (uracil(1939)-C(5))-methyltransferase RlmD [Anaeropeptidivorans aminofermentans]|uniref:23S rRNA (uracil(1939)-C(5))-methyltransferase RlmD n=1 Tax=Anaeropeptidivorans aminofermentans TaxID=2934315 RepID=UPI002023F0EC|nr:23S rRNA (uracil(1939)-C(5))-methyltransferase RlmD [Anaeropeptidivorans aminofermentans]
MFKKNDETEILISDIGTKGEGIGKINDFVFFVDGALPGDICLIKILKVNKSYGYGKIIEIRKPSPDRVLSPCPVSDKCGGCSLMHLNYEAQLKLKQKKVKDSLERIGGFKNIEVSPVVPMENLRGYRNKAQVPVRNVKGNLEVGFFAKNSHNLIPVTDCYIQTETSSSILEKIKEYAVLNAIPAYDEENHSGILRHVLIKTGFKTGEIMVVLAVNLKEGKPLKNQDSLIDSLKVVEGMKSIVLNYNSKKNNTILGISSKTLWGSDYISDYLGEMKFKISPLSFYQVNPVQTEKMYKKALEFADIKETDTVIDAYCGIGSISLFLAQKAKKVIGIEIVEDAVKDAEFNAQVNNIKNAEFIAGKSEEVIYDLINKEIKADVLVVDPPRKGCDERFLSAVADFMPEKIVYVSCNPDTLARDLKFLGEKGYNIKEVQPFDMFGFSYHVETVIMMTSCGFKSKSRL